MSRAEVLACLASLRQHQQRGQRSPHKPLLVLFALGQLAATGSSALAWSTTADRLADLIRDYGPPSTAAPAQRAAYPFTRLRSDKIWTLDHDVPMDRIQPLTTSHVVGRLAPALENALRDPDTAAAAARQLVQAEFPPTIAPDVLLAVGLDPDTILIPTKQPTAPRQRQRSWSTAILTAWNRQCAFCGFDGQLSTATVGVEAAQIRWFTFDGPDDPDDGLALCSLHHKLFDHGALGLRHEPGQGLHITVSANFTSRTTAGQTICELHRRQLCPRPGHTTRHHPHRLAHPPSLQKPSTAGLTGAGQPGQARLVRPNTIRLGVVAGGARSRRRPVPRGVRHRHVQHDQRQDQPTVRHDRGPRRQPRLVDQLPALLRLVPRRVPVMPMTAKTSTPGWRTKRWWLGWSCSGTLTAHLGCPEISKVAATRDAVADTSRVNVVNGHAHATRFPV